MKVICFRGIGNTGKSRVIKKTINKFFKIIIIPDKKDYCLSFNYKNKRIGICGIGDVRSIMEEKIGKLVEQGCDIIICACHPSGETINFINETFVRDVEFIECNWNNGESEEEKDNQTNERFEKFKRKFEECLKE